MYFERMIIRDCIRFTQFLVSLVGCACELRLNHYSRIFFFRTEHSHISKNYYYHHIDRFRIIIRMPGKFCNSDYFASNIIRCGTTKTNRLHKVLFFNKFCYLCVVRCALCVIVTVPRTIQSVSVHSMRIIYSIQDKNQFLHVHFLIRNNRDLHR